MKDLELYNMLNSGLDLDTVSKSTGISIKKIIVYFYSIYLDIDFKYRMRIEMEIERGKK